MADVLRTLARWVSVIALAGTTVAAAPVVAVTGLTDDGVQVAIVGDGAEVGRERTAAPGLRRGVVPTSVRARPARRTSALPEVAPSGSPGGPAITYQAPPAAAPEPNPPADPVVLPVEVLSAEPTAREVTVFVPLEPIGNDLVFEARVFGLDYPRKATLEINDSFSLALENATVRLPPRQAAYGGIGGPYSTLRIQVPLPAGTIHAGRNRVRFVFNGTDGDSIGYRVLRFNLLDDGVPLIPSSQFVEDDPAGWTAPSSDPAVVAAGRDLWSNKALVLSSLPRAPLIQARCSDCHARDGADLKYFNYSNLSIIERSRFHGLTEEEGRAVASYIRALPGPAPGRPWNPPYQPGPGVDSRPVSEWAAGAGVDFVLENDADTYGYLFRDGIPSEWDLTSVLNVREVPVAVELPVWNLWLPKVHPLDYYGDLFQGGRIDRVYQAAEANPALARGMPDAARAWSGFVAQMSSAFAEAFSEVPGLLNETRAVGAAAIRTQNLGRYGIHQWRMVKAWELMRGHDLDGAGRQLRDLGLYPDPPSPAKEVPDRTWLGDGFAFRTAPHMAHLVSTGHGIRDGTLSTWNYISLAWYYLQLVLDDNHRRGDGAMHWPYMVSFTGLGSQGQTFGAVRAVALFKAMEAHYNNFRPADGVARAWSYSDVRIDMFSPASPAALVVWKQTPPEIWRPMVESFLRAYLERTEAFSVEEYRAAYPWAFTGPGVASLGTHADSSYWLPQWYWAFKDFKARGIDPQIIGRAATFAQRLWPEYASDFARLRGGGP